MRYYNNPEAAGGDANLKIVQGYLELMKAHGDAQMMMRVLADEVKHLKICKAYDKDNRKLEVSFRPGSASEAVWRKVIRGRFIQEAGARELVGSAPPGDLEQKSGETLKW